MNLIIFMRMYITLVECIHFDVKIKASLYTQIIGFPNHTNSKGSNNDHNEKQETEAACIYKPLYEMCNICLQK